VCLSTINKNIENNHLHIQNKNVKLKSFKKIGSRQLSTKDVKNIKEHLNNSDIITKQNQKDIKNLRKLATSPVASENINNKKKNKINNKININRTMIKY
jgi:hypothetical protein